MAQNGSKSPECLENDFRNYHHWNFALIVVVLVGQMTNLGRFRVWGQHDLGVKKITEIVCVQHLFVSLKGVCATFFQWGAK